MSDVRQRARDESERHKRALEFAGSKPIICIEDLEAFAIAESSLARKQEREANCAAICIHCRDSSHSEKYTGKAEPRDGKWVHQEIGYSEKCVFDCAAAGIYELTEKEEKNCARGGDSLKGRAE